MILYLILCISICQIGMYLISRKLGWKYGRNITFFVLIIGYLFVLPRFFYPELDPEGINCGMPILGINLAFLVIGGGAAILVHLISYLFERFVKKKRLKF